MAVVTVSSPAPNEPQECAKFGPVEKLKVYAGNPEGVVSVRFKAEEAAHACIEKMRGRFFGGRKVEAHMWDGFTNYYVKVRKGRAIEVSRHYCARAPRLLGGSCGCFGALLTAACFLFRRSRKKARRRRRRASRGLRVSWSKEGRREERRSAAHAMAASSLQLRSQKGAAAASRQRRRRRKRREAAAAAAGDSASREKCRTSFSVSSCCPGAAPPPGI